MRVSALQDIENMVGTRLSMYASIAGVLDVLITNQRKKGPAANLVIATISAAKLLTHQIQAGHIGLPSS